MAGGAPCFEGFEGLLLASPPRRMALAWTKSAMAAFALTLAVNRSHPRATSSCPKRLLLVPSKKPVERPRAATQSPAFYDECQPASPGYAAHRLRHSNAASAVPRLRLPRLLALATGTPRPCLPSLLVASRATSACPWYRRLDGRRVGPRTRRVNC